MWSQAMVFLASFSEISLASELMRVMNSTQHSMSTSRASLEKAMPEELARISLTIFWTVAVGWGKGELATDDGRHERKKGGWVGCLSGWNQAGRPARAWVSIP